MTMIVTANDAFASPINWFTPRVSSVIDVAPVEDAPLGLHYFAPSNIPIGVHDMMRALSYMLDNQIYGMAGMRSGSALQRMHAFSSPRRSTPFEQDTAYGYGYNPVNYYPGIGPVLYGNHIAGSSMTLPTTLAVIRIVAGIGKIIRKIIQDPQMMLTGFVKHEFYDLQSMVTDWLREFIIQREIANGDTRIKDGTLTVRIWPSPMDMGEPLSFSFDQYSLQKWEADPEFAEFVKVALVLYPDWFVEHAPQQVCFNDFILIHTS